MIGLDVTVDYPPKGHPKVAGEGIEYTWANSKLAHDDIGAYHYLKDVAPIKDKQSSTKMTTLSTKDIERMKRTYQPH
eukprot:238753-Ditylum_brightwellii.AAC.1